MLTGELTLINHLQTRYNCEWLTRPEDM